MKYCLYPPAMVIYDLQCEEGHRFEGWFPDPKSFEEQLSKGLISCSVCGETHVTKLPTASHFSKSAGPIKKENPNKNSVETHVNVDPVILLKSLQHFVKNNFKNVGEKFADQSIKMHKGEIEKKPIYGTAQESEKEKLDEEGVAYSTLPTLPEEYDN